MAHKVSPRKLFNFSISFPGFPYEPFLCQKFTAPDREVEVAEHSEGNYDVKTGGRVKIGNATLEGLKRSSKNTESLFFWDWLNSVQDPYLGGGLPPAQYYRPVEVVEFAEDGATVINRWLLEEVFPIKINGQAWDRKSSDNTIETIEFSVNLVDQA